MVSTNKTFFCMWETVQVENRSTRPNHISRQGLLDFGAALSNRNVMRTTCVILMFLVASLKKVKLLIIYFIPPNRYKI